MLSILSTIKKQSYIYCISIVFLLNFIVFLHIANAGAIINKPPVTLGLISGLVGYWSFDGPDMGTTSAIDRSGNNNTGWLTNGPTRQIGKIGQALNFDGGNDYVYVGDASAIDITGNITVTAWVKFNRVAKNQRIVSKWGDTGPEEQYVLATDETTSNELSFAIFTGAYEICDSLASSGTYVANRWYFLVGTYDGTNCFLYLNGVDVTDRVANTDGSIQSTATPLRFGAEGDLSNTFLDGLIDEVRVYNRVLSPDEIKRLYKIGATAKIGVPSNTGTLKDGLVGYWSFDGQDTGTTSAVDLSGNNNTGWFNNGAKKTIGKIGQGLWFDGNNDNAVISHSTNFDQNHDLTISFWIKTATQGHQYIMGKYSGSGSNGWMLGSDSCWGSAGYISFYTDSVAGCVPTSALVPDIATNDGSWHHIAALVDRTAVIKSMYIDGRFAGSKSLATANINTSNLRLGEVNAGAKFFGGTMDEVRIYNRVLSVNEIKRLYKIGATAKIGVAPSTGTLKDGLVGHWSFDGQDTGTTSAVDKSGNNNTGWFINGPRKTAGKIGQALSFDGGDDYINAGSNASIDDIFDADGGGGTVSVWIKPRSMGEEPDTSGGIILNKQTNLIWSLYLNSNNVIKFNYACTDLGFTPWNIWKSANNAVAVNVWQHVVLVYDRNLVTNQPIIYMNGFPISLSQTSSADDGPCAGDAQYDLLIGGIYGSGNFDGLIDDIRMYDRALSADEIKRLYNMGR